MKKQTLTLKTAMIAVLSFLGIGYAVIHATPAVKSLIGSTVATSPSQKCPAQAATSDTQPNDVYFTSCGAFF